MAKIVWSQREGLIRERENKWGKRGVLRWRTCQDSQMNGGGERVLKDKKDGRGGSDMKKRAVVGRKWERGIKDRFQMVWVRRKKRGSPVSSAGMGFIKVLSSQQAPTAKVMTGEFRWAEAEGWTITLQTRAGRSHSRRWPRNTATWQGGSPLFDLDV